MLLLVAGWQNEFKFSSVFNLKNECGPRNRRERRRSGVLLRNRRQKRDGEVLDHLRIGEARTGFLVELYDDFGGNPFRSTDAEPRARFIPWYELGQQAFRP
jgi:hypothetical protein